MLRLALLLLPIAEIAGFILVGGWIGLGPTLLLVVLAGVAGALLLRGGGIATALALREASRGGGRGAQAVLLRGGFRLLAGVLLIVPGFLTDLVALLLLLPPVQALALARLGRAAEAAGVRMEAGRRGPPEGRASGRGDVIEADWIEVEAPPAGPRDPARPPSGWTRP